jgi:hypothetical protein
MPNQTVSTPASKGERAEVANYVAALAADLAAVARQHGLETLGYILEMARMEAENESRPRSGNRR